jgi:hypothetical protein
MFLYFDSFVIRKVTPGMCRNIWLTETWFLFKATGAERGVVPLITDLISLILWYAVAQLFETLRYKPEGRGFDSRWCHSSFSFT